MRFAGEDEEYLCALFAPETLEKKPWDGPDHIVINKLERDSKGVVVVESDSPFQDRFLKLPYEKRLEGSNGIVAYTVLCNAAGTKLTSSASAAWSSCYC